MARFGKQAELEAQKSVQGVECLVSVSDDNLSDRAVKAAAKSIENRAVKKMAVQLVEVEK